VEAQSEHEKQKVSVEQEVLYALQAALTYIVAARRAREISLCKLLLRDDIEPRIRKVLKILKGEQDASTGNRKQNEDIL
jgi:hypothetical protein